jgi:hypothetical protein
MFWKDFSKKVDGNVEFDYIKFLSEIMEPSTVIKKYLTQYMVF